ncbi:MAG: hypothetical protein ACRDN9_05230 [Streptosporangiaceae bacterium]
MRKAQRCGMCRRRYRWQGALVALVSLLTLAASGARVAQMGNSVTPPGCGAEWYAVGLQVPLPPPRHPPQAWLTTREVVTAPPAGVAYLYARTRGMALCDVGPMTVAFLPSAGEKVGGTTVGDIFLTRVQPLLTIWRAQALAAHEARHVSQWTVLTLAGGPLALPVLYGVDEVFFPGPRNHFERDAGLLKGGYRRPASFGPRPQWGAVTVLGIVVLLVARRRLRWASRVLVHGGAGGRAVQAGRCPLHSHGWFRVPQRPYAPAGARVFPG